MSFLTCRCDLPQKLHRSCSLPSLARATCLLLLRKGGSAQDQKPLARFLVARKTPEDARFAGFSLPRHDLVLRRVQAQKPLARFLVAQKTPEDARFAGFSLPRHDLVLRRVQDQKPLARFLVAQKTPEDARFASLSQRPHSHYVTSIIRVIDAR